MPARASPGARVIRRLSVRFLDLLLRLFANDPVPPFGFGQCDLWHRPQDLPFQSLALPTCLVETRHDVCKTPSKLGQTAQSLVQTRRARSLCRLCGSDELSRTTKCVEKVEGCQQQREG